jgi:flagellar protein FlaF
MYRFNYAEVLEESPKTAREREHQAILHSVALLTAAEAKGPSSKESVEALFFVQRLWAAFIEDLARSDNDLPPALKADLISIGIWILGETDNIRLNKSKNYRGIIDVSQSIAEGLK